MGDRLTRAMADMQSRIEVVVSRYREDVSWVDGLGLSAIVYDKSGTPGPTALPNVGRESHTYLWHIVHRWPDFSDYTAFVQGSPFAHLEAGSGPADLSRAIVRAVERGVPFSGLAWYRIRCDVLGRPHDMCDPKSKGKWAGWGKDIPVGRLYSRLFAGRVPSSFVSGSPAGLFMVSRERILARPLAFYRLALALSEADPADADNTGHAFERLWQIIFNGYEPLNRNDYELQLAEIGA